MIRRWVPISFIVVAVALALAGGAVLAAGGGDNDRRTDIFERAAEILGIGPSQLADAHDQATRELRDKKIASIIEKLVSDGIIEQSEADSFTAWVTDRPDSADEALFPSLTSSAFNLRSLWLARSKLRGLGLQTNGDLIALMAELLGIDAQELTDALESGATDVTADSRLAAMHMAIDDRLESGSITTGDADELHAWVDTTPRWLLEEGLGSRALQSLALGLSPGGQYAPGSLKGFGFRLPPGGGHFQRGDGDFFFDYGSRDFKFDFEFHLPEGSFRFGPGGFDGLKGLEGLEGLNNLEGLFERFRGLRGHDFRFQPWIEPGEPKESSGSSSTSA